MFSSRSLVTLLLIGAGTVPAVARMLAYQQCGPGMNPVPGVIIGLSLLLVLSLLRGFFSGFSGFLPSTKFNTSKFQLDLESAD